MATRQFPALAGAGLALVLAGCTVGPDFEPPKADTPASWSDAAPRTQTAARGGTVTDAPADVAHWWTTLNDPTLTSLVERAVSGNPDVREVALRIEESRAQRRITGADQWFNLNGSGGYTRQKISPNGIASSFGGGGGGSSLGGSQALPGGILQKPFDIYQLGFDSSWEIDLWGRVRRSVEAADADIESAIEDERNELVSLAAEVGRTYVELRGYQRERAITEDNLKAEQDVLRITRERQRAGFATALDVAQAEAQVATTAAQLPTYDRQVGQAINQLSRLVGREPGALRSELETPRATPPLPPQVPIGLPADLVRKRPDIRRAEAQLHAATARIGVAIADLFPRLTLSADIGLQAQRARDLGDWASHFYSFGPSLTLPIFDAGRRQATITLREADQQLAAVTYGRTVLDALHEVENDLIAYGTEQDRRSRLERSAAADREALKLARQRYVSGLASFLDVLDAERALLQAETQLADSTVNVLSNLIALYKGLGGGWEGAEQRLAPQPGEAQSVAQR